MGVDAVHILKIATMSLPIVGEDGFLYGTDIKGRLEAENFKGNGTLEMAKPSYKRRWQAPDLRTIHGQGRPYHVMCT